MGADGQDIASLILKRLQEFAPGAELVETGTVVTVGDGVARVYGLGGVVSGELVLFPHHVPGIVLNLDEDGAGVVILGAGDRVRAQDQVVRTGRVVEVPVGPGLRGRVVDALGNPVDGRGPMEAREHRRVESPAPGVAQRQPVNQPLLTGIKAVDALVPIGRGQRELIIGDRETGKTALAVDTIINQRGQDVYCVYVGVGMRKSALARLAHILEETGALEYTTIVAAPAGDPPALQYLAPFAGCAMAEYAMYRGDHALVVYDDLSRHAVAYRAMSLLLRRPPGREAYPGDVFYLHSRLLERSAQLSPALGGGSMTALPIVTTLAGDISAYIPTNVISITDGQVYLEPDLFFAGVRPAVNVGLSVSRVGGAAQPASMRRAAGQLRLELAQYRELAAFSRFASELDPSTRARLQRGERIVEALKQPQYRPVPVWQQVALVFAAVEGFLDPVPVKKVRDFEREIASYLRAHHPALLADLEGGEWTGAIEASLESAIRAFSEHYYGMEKGSEPTHGQDQSPGPPAPHE
ncbi:MAG: F0F1 ATP synthase subunit alpha [Bacillota bacterium]